MYALHCRYKDQEFDLTWDGGDISGDPNATLLLEATAEVYEEAEVPIGPPTGPFVTEDYLSDPLAALWLMREVFEVLDASGDVPLPPPIPEGAIP